MEGRLQWTHEGVCVCEEYTHTDRHRHTQTDTQTHEMQASHILEHKGVWAGRVSEADTAELNLGNPVGHLVATGDANLGRTVHQLEDAHTRAHGLARASTVSREQGGGMDGTTARFVQRQWQSREWRGGTGETRAAKVQPFPVRHAAMHRAAVTTDLHKVTVEG